MLTIIEYVLNNRVSPATGWQAIGIPDGWRPLAVFERPHQVLHGCVELVLAVQADTEAEVEREIIRVVQPGDDIGAIMEQEGVELAHLGQAGGQYVFLDVPPQLPRRVISHPDLIARLEAERKRTPAG